ncbi:MAG: hypothetical protein J0M00_12650 [Burkholderiales bacterium]|jgi:hypothetical protein|nr:hypothetical protein [Burkholderiales bacterium]
MDAFSSPSPAPSLLQRMLASIVRFVLVLGGMLLMAGALLLGMVVATGVVIWALLRGRRPGPVNLRWGTMPRPRGFGRPAGGEVVDVQVREVDTTRLP